MSGNAFVSYCLSPILTSVGLTSDLQQTLINATNQMLSWFSALYFATLPAKIGRRIMFLCSLVSMWIVVICITVGSAVLANNNDNKAAAYAVVVFLYLFSPAYNFGFNGNLGLYIPEILPYRLRTHGLAIFYFVQFSFMILSTFAIPVGLENIQWRLYIVFIAWIVIEFVGVRFTFPETKGPSLEDIAYIFDAAPPHTTRLRRRDWEIPLLPSSKRPRLSNAQNCREVAKGRRKLHGGYHQCFSASEIVNHPVLGYENQVVPRIIICCI